MSVLRLCFVFILLTPALAYSAVLENPANDSLYSGIGVISGWKCTANGTLTVRFNGGDPVPLAYGNERVDVRGAGACPGANVGFVSIWNWANLGAGEHTAVVYDAGVEFARSAFRVESLGTEFLRGVTGEGVVRNFPSPNTDVVLRWEEPIQQFVVAQVSDGGAAAGRCCRWLHLDCARASMTEREYNWRNGQVAAGACVAPPQDDTGLVGVVHHVQAGIDTAGLLGPRNDGACERVTDELVNSGRWTALSNTRIPAVQDAAITSSYWVMGPYTCGERLFAEASFDDYSRGPVYGVALDGRLFIGP